MLNDCFGDDIHTFGPATCIKFNNKPLPELDWWLQEIYVVVKWIDNDLAGEELYSSVASKQIMMKIDRTKLIQHCHNQRNVIEWGESGWEV